MSFETGDAATPTGYKCVCNTADGYLLSADGTVCLQGCGANELLSLSGDRCVFDCPVQGTIQGVNSASIPQCVCSNDRFILEDNSGCVEECDDNDVISLDGNICQSNCGANEVPDEGRCVCDSSNGALLSLDTLRCELTCTSGLINLRGDGCVTSGTCGNGAVDNTAGDACECDSTASPATPKINVAGDQCFETCPVGSNDADGDNLCECNGGETLPEGFIRQDGSCSTSCEAGQFVSLDRTRCLDNCPALNQVRGTVNSLPSCVCDTDSYLDIMGENCVQACEVDDGMGMGGTVEAFLDVAGFQCKAMCDSGNG